MRATKTLMLTLGLLAVTAAYPDTWYVSPDGNDGNSGGSWAEAFKTISNGVAQASDGDVVLLTNGTHQADGTGVDSISQHAFAGGISMVTVTKGVTIRGSSGNPADTIIDGGYPDFTNRLFYINHADAMLEAVTVTKGFAVTNGGGAYLWQGLVSNCVFAGNTASNAGGGIYLLNSGTVTHCRVQGNISSSRSDAYYGGGGGIFMRYGGAILESEIVDNADTYRGVGGVAVRGPVLLRRCVFTNNSGPYGAALSLNGLATPALVDDCDFSGHASAQRTVLIYACADPGIFTNCRVYDNAILGLQMSSRNALVTDCMFSNNTGGGLHIWVDPKAYGHSNTIANCTFANNSASRGGGILINGRDNIVTGCLIQANSAGTGGGIATYYTYVTNNLVTHCAIVSNISSDNGGGVDLASAHGNDTVQFCRITHNTAASDGGGIRALDYGGVLLRNNLIVSNSANNHGGGVRASVGYVTNESCTIAFNHAANSGGGLSLIGTNNVVNCIIVSNTAVSAGDDIYLQYASASNSFWNCCTPGITNPAQGNIGGDPRFRNPDAENYRLADGSTCINAGTNLPWMAEAADLDGLPRRDRFSRLADMGCYEYISRGTLIGVR